MSEYPTFEITTSKGSVYHIQAPDEETAHKVGLEIDGQESTVGDVHKMQFPQTGAVVDGPPNAGGGLAPAAEQAPVIPGYKPENNSFLNTGMGLALRGVAKGATAIPGALVDAITGNPGDFGQVIDSAFDSLGAKRPQSYADRMVEAGMSGLGGGAATGVAPISNAVGTLAGQQTAENGGGTGAQIAAALLAGSAPGLLKTGASAAIRGAMRGSDPTAVRDVVNTFKTAGTTSTVAEATGGDKATAVEGFLSQLFGSGGIVRGRRAAQEAEIGNNLTGKADKLYPAMSNEDMGAYISSNADEGFKPQGRAILDQKYQMLEKQLPGNTRVDARSLQDYIGKKSAIDPNAANISTNPLLGGGDQGAWASAGADLKKDLVNNLKTTGVGGLPLASVKALRSRIGQKIEDAAFNESGGNIGDLRGAYGVLSESMKDAAAKAGPAAQKAFDDATTAASHYHDILETVKPVIDKSGGFEKVFTSSLAGTKDGGTVIRNVYHLLSPDARQAMTSQILRRAAKPASGDPEAFDMVKFAKNYSNMDGEAKKVIFDSSMQNDLDAISKTINKIQHVKEQGGVATTAAQGRVGVQAALMSPVYLAAGIGGGAAASHPVLGGLAGAAVPAGMVAARQTAKWMMNPKTVKFLAETTKMPKEQIPLAISNLAIQGQKENDPDQIELAKYLQSQMQGDQ